MQTPHEISGDDIAEAMTSRRGLTRQIEAMANDTVPLDAEARAWWQDLDAAIGDARCMMRDSDKARAEEALLYKRMLTFCRQKIVSGLPAPAVAAALLANTALIGEATDMAEALANVLRRGAAGRFAPG